MAKFSADAGTYSTKRQPRPNYEAEEIDFIMEKLGSIPISWEPLESMEPWQRKHSRDSCLKQESLFTHRQPASLGTEIVVIVTMAMTTRRALFLSFPPSLEEKRGN